jgi:hypothetical protein
VRFVVLSPVIETDTGEEASLGRSPDVLTKPEMPLPNLSLLEKTGVCCV